MTPQRAAVKVTPESKWIPKFNLSTLTSNDAHGSLQLGLFVCCVTSMFLAELFFRSSDKVIDLLWSGENVRKSLYPPHAGTKGCAYI
jgi:hypothetical protein